MNLPDGYFIRTENASTRRMLMEDAKVYRPVRDGYPKVLESEVRSVAGFPRGVSQREIQLVAKLDARSRDLAIPRVERQAALEALAEKFRGDAM